MLRTLFLGTAPGVVLGRGGLANDSDGILHTPFERSLHAVNSDGSIKWIFNADGLLGPFAEGLNRTVYATTYRDQAEPPQLFALDGLDGSIKWKHQVDGNRQLDTATDAPFPIVVATDGTIYLTSFYLESPMYFCNSTTIDAINAIGAVKWTFTRPGCGSLAGVGADGTLFVKSESLQAEKSLAALDPDTGTLKWSVVLDQHHHHRQVLFAFTKDSNAIVFESTDTDGVLSSLSNEDGSVLWNYSFPLWNDDPHFQQWMTMGSNNEVFVNGLMLTDGMCSLRAFDLHGVTFRDMPCLGGRPQYNSEEDMFVAVWEYYVLAHAGTNGRLLWKNSPHDHNVHLFQGMNSHQPPVIFGQNGMVFVWSEIQTDHRGTPEGGRTYAIQNGEVVWSVQTDGVHDLLAAENGITYIQGSSCHPNHEGCLLDTFAVGADGKEMWKFTPPEAVAEFV